MKKTCLLIISCLFLCGADLVSAKEPMNDAVFGRSDEEWPVFNKEQLKILAQGRRAYSKNPVTGKGELFFVAKNLTPEEAKAFKKFRDNIYNTQSGDLQPALLNKNAGFNLYDSPYGKIKIVVIPDAPGADPDVDDVEGDHTLFEGNHAIDPRFESDDANQKTYE